MADITPSDSNNYTAPVPPSGDLLKLMGIDDFVVEVATGNILQPTLTTEQLVGLIKAVGRHPIERDTLYNVVTDYNDFIFEKERIRAY